MSFLDRIGVEQALVEASVSSAATARRLSGAGPSVLAVIFGPCQCEGIFECEEIDGHVGILLWFGLLVYVFKVLGSVCDEYFVPSLEAITEQLQLSNDVAGATFMAAGSSAPELFTSLVTTFFLVSEGGVGTIIGSAIFNILVIVGATCFYAQNGELTIWWYPLTRDSIFYLISILELFIFLYGDEKISWYEGVIMTVSYFIYIGYMKVNERIAGLFGGSPSEEDDQNDDARAEGGALDGAPSGAKGIEDAGLADGSTGGAPGGPPLTVRNDASEEEVPATTSVPGTVPAASAQVVGHMASGGVGGSASPTPVGPGRSRTDNLNTSVVPRPSISGGSGSGSFQAPPTLARQGSFNIHGGHPPMWSNKQLKRSKTTLADLGEHTTTDEAQQTAVQQMDDEEDEEEQEKKGWLRDPLEMLLEKTMPSPENHHWLLFFASISWIALLSYMMVDACERIGCILNISKLVMGLVFLAAGTSVPDALGSIAVAKQGEGDMAVANALGSNVFDIMLGLGVPWTIKTLAMGEEPTFPGASTEIVYWILILVVVLVLFVGSLVANRWRLNRRMGTVLLGLYAIYVMYALIKGLILDS